MVRPRAPSALDVPTPTGEFLSSWQTHSLAQSVQTLESGALGLKKAGGLTLDHSVDLPPFLISLFRLSSHD